LAPTDGGRPRRPSIPVPLRLFDSIVSLLSNTSITRTRWSGRRSGCRSNRALLP
jgi:hypothetical protein